MDFRQEPRSERPNLLPEESGDIEGGLPRGTAGGTGQVQDEIAQGGVITCRGGKRSDLVGAEICERDWGASSLQRFDASAEQLVARGLDRPCIANSEQIHGRRRANR